MPAPGCKYTVWSLTEVAEPQMTPWVPGLTPAIPEGKWVPSFPPSTDCCHPVVFHEQDDLEMCRLWVLVTWAITSSLWFALLSAKKETFGAGMTHTVKPRDPSISLPCRDAEGIEETESPTFLRACRCSLLPSAPCDFASFSRP